MDHLNAAMNAAASRDWETAVTELRAALKRLGKKAPDELRQSLAIVLANRGNATANRAISEYSKMQQLIQTQRQKHPNEEADIQEVFDKIKEGHVALPTKAWVLSFEILALGVSLLLASGAVFSDTRTASWVASWAGGPGSVVVLLVLVLLCSFTFYISAGRGLVAGLVLLSSWLARSVRRTTTMGLGRSPCDICSEAASYTVQLGPGRRSASLCSTHSHELECAVLHPCAGMTIEALRSARKDLQEASSLAPNLTEAEEGLRQVDTLIYQLGG